MEVYDNNAYICKYIEGTNLGANRTSNIGGSISNTYTDTEISMNLYSDDVKTLFTNIGIISNIDIVNKQITIDTQRNAINNEFTALVPVATLATLAFPIIKNILYLESKIFRHVRHVRNIKRSNENIQNFNRCNKTFDNLIETYKPILYKYTINNNLYNLYYYDLDKPDSNLLETPVVNAQCNSLINPNTLKQTTKTAQTTPTISNTINIAYLKDQPYFITCKIDDTEYKILKNSILPTKTNNNNKVTSLIQYYEIIDKIENLLIELKNEINSKPPQTAGSSNKKITKEKFTYKGKSKSIYIGPRGGKYIKSNNKFISCKKL
jgi:hypothetical protein